MYRVVINRDQRGKYRTYFEKARIFMVMIRNADWARYIVRPVKGETEEDFAGEKAGYCLVYVSWLLVIRLVVLPLQQPHTCKIPLGSPFNKG